MAENAVNNEENVNSQSSQLEEEDLHVCTNVRGDEVHVSFAALSQTHSVQPTVTLAIVLLISTLTNKLCRTFLSCLL